jgi:hypothetical protein
MKKKSEEFIRKIREKNKKKRKSFQKCLKWQEVRSEKYNNIFFTPRGGGLLPPPPKKGKVSGIG